MTKTHENKTAPGITKAVAAQFAKEAIRHSGFRGAIRVLDSHQYDDGSFEFELELRYRGSSLELDYSTAFVGRDGGVCF